MQATPNIGKAEHNNVDGSPNVSHIKIAKKLGIPVRNVTGTMLGTSDAGENVVRLLQVTQI